MDCIAHTVAHVHWHGDRASVHCAAHPVPQSADVPADRAFTVAQAHNRDAHPVR